ncbi:MAG: hypothetical protein E7774_09375 [Bradyrhizobium sp.]|nr:MAG: hypothetical protein E7774_09375 [Bradyrhizobium sp.]
MTAIACPRPLPRALSLAVTFAAASLCVACGSLDGIWPGANSARNPGVAKEGQTDAEKIVRNPLTAGELDCPDVEIDEGGASARVGGPDNAAVRYQFDINTTARECDPLSDTAFSLKVGVSGHLLIGPAGKPGSYSTGLRVIVHDEVAKKDAFSKVYKIEANADNGAGAPFTFVTDPIELPMTRTELADDYTLTVGFDNGKSEPAAPKPHKPRAAKTPAAKAPAPD